MASESRAESGFLEQPMQPVAVIEREDLALFINAASTCTGQREFYGSPGQHVALGFLHAYVFGNYRRLYALCLAAGVNHFNSILIIERLLRAGAPTDPQQRREEGALIAGALRKLPPQRVYRLFRQLRRSGVNNRRTRATVKHWLAGRDLAFDAVKYRGGLRSAARHTHQRLPSETHAFLFEGPHSRKGWETGLYDSFRRARYDQSAIYELPFTIAEGLAVAKGIPRKRFLERASATMTHAERVRLLRHAEGEGVDVRADLGRAPPTQVAKLILARPVKEREPLREALHTSASRVSVGPLPTRVHAVLDRSFSSRSGAQKRNHALAVTLGVHAILAANAPAFRPFWTAPLRDALGVTPRGQTDLATPLLDALEERPELLLVVSDGFENDPPGAAAEVLRLYRAHVDPDLIVLHLNPVFDAESYAPRPLGDEVPTVGLRNAEELPLKLEFARFVAGSTGIDVLEAWLRHRARSWLEALC